MENKNTILDFTDYIEKLCENHTYINHTEEKKHFLELGNDQQLQEGKKLYYPIVTMEKLTVSYSGVIDSIRKERYIELMFLDHVKDSGDFNSVKMIWDKMETIAEDFIKKIDIDRKNTRDYPFLKQIRINNAELDYVENISTHLWGVLLSFNIDVSFNMCLDENRFK